MHTDPWQLLYLLMSHKVHKTNNLHIFIKAFIYNIINICHI